MALTTQMGSLAWAPGLREHVTEGVHIATVSGVEDPDLQHPDTPDISAPP